MSNLKSWAVLFRAFGVFALLVGSLTLLSYNGMGLAGLVLGVSGFIGLFFLADVVMGLQEVISYFARQNRKAGK